MQKPTVCHTHQGKWSFNSGATLVWGILSPEGKTMIPPMTETSVKALCHRGRIKGSLACIFGGFLQLELCGCQVASFSLLSKARCEILTSFEEFWGNPDSVKWGKYKDEAVLMGSLPSLNFCTKAPIYLVRERQTPSWDQLPCSTASCTATRGSWLKKNPNLKFFSVFPSWEKLRWSHCPKNISLLFGSIETGKDATTLSRAFKRDTRTSFNPGLILHQGIQKGLFSLLKGKKLKSRISPPIKYTINTHCEI